MDDLFLFVKEKTIKTLIEVSDTYPVEQQKRMIIKIDEIRLLENFRQLVVYIEKKLLKQHGFLKHHGINHKHIKKNLVLYKGNNRLASYLFSKKIPIDEIFHIINLDINKKRIYLSKNRSDLVEYLKEEKINPFGRTTCRKVKKTTSKKIRLIYTPMGNKMR
jgi:hypothetical protein